MRHAIRYLCAAALLACSGSSFAANTCMATSSAPTNSANQEAALSCDLNGNLRTSGASGGSTTANQGTAGSSAWPVKTTPNATAATTTTTLAGADAIVAAADATATLRVCANNGSATAYVSYGHAATASGDTPLTVGGVLFEDHYTGDIHAYGTGAFACTKVTP